MKISRTLSGLLGALALAGASFAHAFVLPEGASANDRTRFAVFENFQIKGVCGDKDLDRLATLGVNTVRGYTFDDAATMRAKLDHAHRLGLKMIVSEWMPHHGKNKNAQGHFWDFDYNAKGDQIIAKFVQKLEALGDHPAILMWGLGNEVHLDEPYLRVVNRMSEEIHKRFPHHLTSLTMVNAKPDHIAKIKQFVPDLDVLGVQSYSRGAVRGSMSNTAEHWGKPFYLSEFNTNGPWNFAKTAWGCPVDEPVTRKVADLKDCYAAIDASPLCLGSTIFVWGHYAVDDRPTYFSTLLDADPAGPKKTDSFDQLLWTPQADVMTEHFTGRPITGNRAPVLSRIEFADGAKSRTALPGETLPIHLAAEDADGDRVTFVTWILQAKTRKVTPLAGPFPQTSGDNAVAVAPASPGEYLVIAYALDGKGGASASVLPFKVLTAEEQAISAATPPANTDTVAIPSPATDPLSDSRRPKKRFF